MDHQSLAGRNAESCIFPNFPVFMYS